MGTRLEVLVIPADPERPVAARSSRDLTSESVSEWITLELKTDQHHCNAMGKRLVVWAARANAGNNNDRAYALWYAVFGSDQEEAAPVPPGLFGTVIVEDDGGELPSKRLSSFFETEAAKAFRFSGNAPDPEEVAGLVRAWKAA